MQCDYQLRHASFDRPFQLVCRWLLGLEATQDGQVCSHICVNSTLTNSSFSSEAYAMSNDGFSNDVKRDTAASVEL